jgi:TolB protein
MRDGIVAGITAAMLLLSAATPAHATFPGQNGKIAFGVYPSQPNSFAIATINPDGTGRATVTSGNGPSWSADGARLILSRDIYGTEPGSNLSQIITASADGSGEQVIIETCGSGCKVFVGGPVWSPDGSRFAHTTTVCGPSDCGTSVSIADSATGQGDGVFSVGGTAPDWSPDGMHIAFNTLDYSAYCYPETCLPDIYAINPDGSSRTPLTGDPASDYLPSWSPDGSKIAFVSDRDRNAEIYTMNADGTAQTRLTDDPATDTSPVWSPDGSQIAFVSYRADAFNSDLYTMNSDGTGVTRLTATAGSSEGSPDWQPLHGPQRSDFKNAAQFCKAERDFLGDEAFRNRYGGGANAYGKCVNANRG